MSRFFLITIAFFISLLISTSGDLQAAAKACVGGMSAGKYPCSGVQLQSLVKLSNFPSRPSAASNVWGYVDPDDNREYAIIGLSNGTGVVDVTDPVKPKIIGVINGPDSAWRELKVFSFFNNSTNKWDAYAYVVTEATDGGLQIINLSKLPNSISLVRTDREISTAHTLLISNVDWATGVALPGLTPYLYVMGANRLQFQIQHEEPGAGRGLTVYKLTRPKNPGIIGSYSDTYMHDIYVETITDNRVSQCAPGHNPCEVVFGYTGSEGFRIIDFTDKQNPVVLGTLQYPGLAFAHSGWISKNKKWLFSFDELDELRGAEATRVRSINVADLHHPTSKVSWTGSSDAIDHNGFVVGEKLYMSSYAKGLVIFDVSKPKRLRPIASFDTRPESDNTEFSGAWGVYPFLPSGNILISDIERGLFILKEE